MIILHIQNIPLLSIGQIGGKTYLQFEFTAQPYSL